MTLYPILKAPLAADLRPLLGALKYAQIDYRVTEEQNQQVLWVAENQQAAAVEIIQRMQQGYSVPVADTKHAASTDKRWLKRIKLAPMTCVIIIVSLIIAAITQLGQQVNSLNWFTFTPFLINDQLVTLSRAGYLALAGNEFWRWFSPAFLHFSVLHITMNLLWLWELGRRIEYRVGALGFISLFLLTSAISNWGQFIYEPSPLFGGLSGVIYALLGYCWIYNRFMPRIYADLPKGIIAMMLIWLVVCMTGVLEVAGFGKIANAAHLAGLISGCILGALFGMLARAKQPQN